MNKVIVTGATSMIGLAFINECIKNGTQVIAIIRENSKKRNLISKSAMITVIECDIAKINSLDLDQKDKFDALYHFAWENTDPNSRNKPDHQLKNIANTLDTVRFAYKNGCKRFIGAGSQAEYGKISGKITTDLNVSPDSAYGIAKYSAGKLAAILSQELGIDFIWTRIFSVYGINDMPTTMIMYCIDCILRGQMPILTRCEQEWEYLNCKDAAKAFWLLGNKGINQTIYNIGSGNPRVLLEYVKELRDCIDNAIPLGIGEKEYSTNQVMSLYADISALERDTGFKPEITFAQGIQETIEWYKELM